MRICVRYMVKIEVTSTRDMIPAPGKTPEVNCRTCRRPTILVRALTRVPCCQVDKLYFDEDEFTSELEDPAQEAAQKKTWLEQNESGVMFGKLLR